MNENLIIGLSLFGLWAYIAVTLVELGWRAFNWWKARRK